MTRVAFAAALMIATALGPGAARGEAPSWMVDVEASRVGFAARQMQVTIPGRFRRFAATILFAAKDLAASSARIVIDVATVETPNRDIETEIKRENWFDVARFPKALFRTTRIEHRTGNRYVAHGLLTLRGVTRPVTLPLTITIADDPDKSDVLRARAVGEATVSRVAFGIGQGKWKDTSVVSDTVTIRFDVVARRPKP